MTRKGKASRRQWKKLCNKMVEGAAVMDRYRRFGKLTPREFYYGRIRWPNPWEATK
jgi:hypothetical protein